jgi:hypothetical protein
VNGLERHASATAVERQSVFACHLLLATVGAYENAPFEDIDTNSVNILL